jgi:hypothetical protein
MMPLILNVLFIVDHSVRFYISMVWLTAAFFIVGCMGHSRRFMYAFFMYLIMVVVYIPSSPIMHISFERTMIRLGYFIGPVLIGTLLSYWFVPAPRRPLDEE